MGINDPGGKWDDINGDGGIRPLAGTEFYSGIIEPKMSWPEATSKIFASLCVTLIIVTIILVAWGPL